MKKNFLRVPDKDGRPQKKKNKNCNQIEESFCIDSTVFFIAYIGNAVSLFIFFGIVYSKIFVYCLQYTPLQMVLFISHVT